MTKRRTIHAALAALIAALALCAAAELLYRGWWAARRALAPGREDTPRFDLYVAGESTAVGEPYAPGIMFSSLVAGMFGGRLAGREIRVLDLARPGESAYPQAEALGRALRLRAGAGPGAVLIYSGHNDAGPLRGPQGLERLRQAVIARSLLLGDLWYCAEKYFPALRLRAPDTYALNLRRMAELSRAAGLTPVLATAVSDVSEIDPGLFAGNAAGRAAAFRAVEAGLALEAGGKWAEAAAYYAGQEAGRRPMLAYLEYRRGKCLLKAGRRAEAAERLRAAVDLAEGDNFGRATSRQNDAARAVAALCRAPLVDAVKLFEAASPDGITGPELFADGHHPNMAGYLLLAGGYARELAKAFGTQVVRTFRSPEEAFRAFSFGPEERALALTDSGRWFFSVAARHVFPAERLGLAARRFRQALALCPGGFSPRLGLALTEAAANSGLLSDPEALKWLGGRSLFYGSAYEIPPGRLEEVLGRLSAWGVPAGELAGLRAAYAGRRDKK
jgi:lysophospholipase L1-like esterase